VNTFTHEEVYRGEDMLKKMAEVPLSFCGAGAIGSNMCVNLIRQGFKNASVIDFDRVDDHNRHTQVYGRRDIGQLKVVMLKNRIYTDMGVMIGDISIKLTEDNIKKLVDTYPLVIDGFDNSESRRIVTDYCTKNNVDCLHVGLYQDYAEVIWNEGYRVPDDTKALDVCEYPLARNVIMMAVAVASESVIRFVSTGVKESYYITLKDLKITRI